MIGISMIIAAGLVKFIEGLYHATVSKQRYWIHQVLLWSSTIYGVNFLWAYKDNLVENPSYIFFASSMSVAATFVLRAHIFVMNDPAQIKDWADHFDKTARPYFVAAFLTPLSTIVAAWSSGESTGFDAQSIPLWLGAGLNATGAISKKAWVRGTVAVTHLTLVVIGSYLLFSNDLI